MSIQRKFSLKEATNEIFKMPCRQCSGDTNHSIVAEYIEEGKEKVDRNNSVDWTDKYQIIRCLGCDEISFRTDKTFSEDMDFNDQGIPYFPARIEYYPSRLAGLRSFEHEELPHNISAIYKETVQAIENAQNILAGIGIRALIEAVCLDLKIEKRNLFDKIDELEKKSIITSEGKMSLNRLRGLGNEAAHKMKRCSTEEALLALKIIEHMIDGAYLIPKEIESTFENRN